MTDARTSFPQALPPSADVQLPPYARSLDVRATRAAFAAGTLSTVSDDTPREDVERDGVARDADRCYLHDVQHDGTTLSSAGVGDQLGCESVLHSSYSRSSRELGSSEVGSEAADPAEALRQARLRRWQTIR